jgi:integrase/recombinase XerD
MTIKKKKSIHKTFVRHKVTIEHTAFYPYLLQYNEAMRIRNYSEKTLHRRDSDIRRFIAWCDERALQHPNEITKPMLNAYQQYLYHYRQVNGEPLSVASRNHYIVSVKQWFKWLAQEDHLLMNPASELLIPQQRVTLPVVLTLDEIEALMQQPEITTPYGLRDRAILELFYSTGLRRSELCNLKMQDLSLSRKTLYVREGKGGKDRLLPIGERALYWLTQYLAQVRPQLLINLHESIVFLNDYGEPFRDSKLGDKVKRFMTHAGITALGSCHLLRHAMATHMLENGAELRYIQVMLGHTDLRSTQLYTHVSIRKLQEIHAQTHPAKLESTAELLQALANELDEE